MSYEIRDVPGKGRGMFAVGQIARGSLILRELPLVFVRDSAMKFPNEDSGDSLSLAFEILQIPGCAEKLRNLHYSPSGVDVQLLLREDALKALTEDEVEWVVGRVSCNSIGYSTFPERIPIMLLDDWQNPKLETWPENSSTGIFLTSSMVNHSCRPTAYRYSVGDELFLRAAKDLAAGEEITISYIPNNILQEASEIKHDFLGNRDFQCNECHDETARPLREPLDLETLVEIRMATPQDAAALIEPLLDDQSVQTSDRVELFLRLAEALKQLGQSAESTYQRCYEVCVAELPWFDFTRVAVAAEFDRKRAFFDFREITQDLSLEVFNEIFP